MAKKWKKNLIKVPSGIQEKIDTFENDIFVISSVKEITKEEINDGMYSHLGIEFTEGELAIPQSILPPPTSGRWSKTNVQGRSRPNHELPKVKKTYAIESPNFGDAARNGTHTIYWEREVYQVDFTPPKHLRIKQQLLEERPRADGPTYVVKFEIDEALDRTSEALNSDLLYNLNVLQENIGASDVFASDASRDEYLQSIHLDWEIFPPGERGEDIRRLAQGRNISAPEMRVLEERYDVIRALDPTHIIRGNSGFQRYFGAKFADDLVVFENLRYGNAVYVMFEDWRNLSQKSRIDLMASDGVGFNRIPHSDGWEKQLRFVVQTHLKRRLDN